MSSWIKQIVRASPDRSDRSWIVATAAHLTPVLITRVYLQQFVFKTSHQIKKNRFVSTAAEMSDPGSRPLDREYASHAVLQMAATCQSSQSRGQRHSWPAILTDTEVWSEISPLTPFCRSVSIYWHAHLLPMRLFPSETHLELERIAR